MLASRGTAFLIFLKRGRSWGNFFCCKIYTSSIFKWSLVWHHLVVWWTTTRKSRSRRVRRRQGNLGTVLLPILQLLLPRLTILRIYLKTRSREKSKDHLILSILQLPHPWLTIYGLNHPESIQTWKWQYGCMQYAPHSSLSTPCSLVSVHCPHTTHHMILIANLGFLAGELTIWKLVVQWRNNREEEQKRHDGRQSVHEGYHKVT